MATQSRQLTPEQATQLAVLDALYQQREKLRKANRPLAVHCLTHAIKIAQGKLATVNQRTAEPA